MALLEYKCPNCGGALGFDTSVQELACPYCKSVVNTETLRGLDDALEQNQEPESVDWGYTGGCWKEGEQDKMAVYSCKSCGGEIVGDETLGATSCPFCGNAVVMTSKFSGTLRPDLVLPFKLDKKAAVAALHKHYLGKRLLPKVFKDQNHLEEIKGVYVPFWLFDADAEARTEYSAAKVRVWSDSRYNYRKVSTYRVRREGGIGFDAIPVDGSKSIDDALMESVEPFRLGEAVPFQTAYLAGFFANKYDVDAEQSMARATERVANSAVAAFRETVTGYQTVTPIGANVRVTKGGVRYALLPVWLLSTRYEGENYLFAMNGQTGKLVGDMPLDKGLYRAWLLKMFGIPAAVLSILAQVIVSLLT
ncbi:MAG: hypothetical protein LBR72_03270 [Oscillospiraceae bacterium]|jgi:DNA-directed RNA polymerase subunit RPC12/RpoP|nr:hypothetical protein [Oscillospiraceae bacterium]